MTAKGAEKAIKAGAYGIVISSHGGECLLMRQLHAQCYRK